jgi:hypothetical protein
MRTKLTTKRNDGRGHEWNILISGYDCFESEDALVSFLNEAGCKTYLNARQEVIACCKAKEITDFMHKAEELYNEANS